MSDQCPRCGSSFNCYECIPERTYTQAELDAAVKAAYEDAAKVAVKWECLGEPHLDIAAAIRKRGE